MSDARILHKKCGGSQKVNSLTNFEHRVWIQYLVSANDLGVMSAAAAVLQAENVFLRRQKLGLVQAALDQVVTVGLVTAFIHQGERFVWQRDWQTWQGIRHPRRTVLPLPPLADIAQMADTATRELFHKYCRDVGDSVSEKILEDFNGAESLACAHRRELLLQSPPSASSSESEESARETIDAMFHRFWLAYPRKKAKGDAEIAFRRAKPTAGLTDVMIRALEWQRTQPDWTKDGGKFVPYPSTWLHGRRWEDEPFHVHVEDPNADAWADTEARIAATRA